MVTGWSIIPNKSVRNGSARVGCANEEDFRDTNLYISIIKFDARDVAVGIDGYCGDGNGCSLFEDISFVRLSDANGSSSRRIVVMNDQLGDALIRIDVVKQG